MKKTLWIILFLAVLILRPESFLSLVIKAPFGWTAKKLTNIALLNPCTKLYDELWEYGHNGPLQRLESYFTRPAALTDRALTFLEEDDGILGH